MKMYIPHLRDRVVLTADWTFKLYDEGRNYSLIDDQWRERARKFGTEQYDAMYERYSAGEITWYQFTHRGKYSELHTWPIGTILSIDRIFIKNAMSEYDSVTFRLVDKKRKGIRFWAKLDDVNEMLFDLLPG